MQFYYAQRVFFPYCLKRLEDGRYAVLNQRHQPLGKHDPLETEYDLSTVAIRLEITPEDAQKLSWQSSNELQTIYLYPEGGRLAEGGEHWATYAERLRVLSRLHVVTR